MDIREKLKAKRRKKKSLVALTSIALVTTTLAVMKLTGFSMPLDNKTNSKIAEATITRLPNTETETYIYDAVDLVAFRDAVNAGDNYSGKTVYLMDDIDLSTVCSSTLGSWTPIGATGTYFAGTFDGNYHTISNLYINSSSSNQGLFTSINGATIEDVNIDNFTVSGVYYVGTIAGNSSGSTIKNCHIKNTNKSSTVTATSKNTYGSYVGGLIGNASGTTTINCSNFASVTGKYNYVGGIIGVSGGTINSCYNSGTVKGSAEYVGGIVGIDCPNLSISNCYNKGTVTGPTSTGGILGGTHGSYYVSIVNCYNIGTVGTATYRGGIIGHDVSANISKISNNYWLSGCGPSYGRGNTKSNSAAVVVATATLQTYTVTLGNAFAYDVYGINSGYPVLAWQNETTVMSLNKNQAYIGIGEKLTLNVVEDDDVTRILENNYSATNFTWTSTNEDVATVNENGVVTGVSDGYTTIYAKYEESGLYAMCVVNVAKEVANPQIEIGNGFTVILKTDGTVWTIGNNESGQLGDGTNKNTKVPVQVYIDEDTILDNIVKIAVGTDHVLALTKDGKIYGWGSNTNGQLGQNNTDSLTYAKPVLSEDGTSYLSNIVDISANGYGSMALDKNGNVYVWGRGTTGEMGNSTTTSSSLPIKTTIKNGIQVSIGDGHAGVLTSEGVVWSWGQNTSGQLGINCAKNTTYPMKTALNVTELSVGGYHTTIKKIDGTLYATGSYSYGRLGTGSSANVTKYTKVNLPSTVTDTNKVKYVKAGIINTTILLEGGTVWETGFNLQGELGNGTKITSTAFVQGLTASETPLTNVLTIGKNNGNVSGSTTTGYGLNTAVITKDGDVYTTGDNSYGQIGDNTETSTTYYTRMGFAYLNYEDKTVEIDKSGYQIDLNKLKYIYSSINAYNNEQIYSLGEIKYTLLDKTIATIDETGKITPKEGVSGILKIKIEDITNNYETYFTIIVNKLENTDTVTYIYSADDLVKFRDKVNAGDNYVGKTVYVMAGIDMSEVCSETIGSWTPIGASRNIFRRNI